MRVFRSIILIAVVLFTSAQLNAQLINAVVGVTGKIINSETKEPVGVDINVYDNSNKLINKINSNSADGYYYIAGLKPGNTYKIEITKDGFFKEIYELNVINSDKYVEISRDFLVRPLKTNVALKIKVPPFEINKSKLRYGAATLLEDMTRTLKNNQHVYFTVNCYPDNMKSPEENKELTKNRASSLKDFFVINGIDPDRINIKGNSEIDPNNPMPKEKAAKGKRYIGSSYIEINKIK